MAEQLVANLAEPFDPARYTDDYRANLMRVIKAKMKGKKAKLEEPEGEAPDSGVLDLMSALRASLEEGSGKKGASRGQKKIGRRHSKAREGEEGKDRLERTMAVKNE